MGFVPLRKGKIKVGGILLEPTTIDAIRRHIAWIPQELALPSEWVKEMISLPFALKANRHISFSEEKLFTCFDELGLDKELYQKRVGEISGGQRQRLAIARALMKHADLYIFDDSFSALDFKTDAALRHALQDETCDAAVLIIAQRISSVMDADLIVVLDDGKISGAGTHDQLMASNHIYQEVYKSQQEGATIDG